HQKGRNDLGVGAKLFWCTRRRNGDQSPFAGTRLDPRLKVFLQKPIRTGRAEWPSKGAMGVARTMDTPVSVPDGKSYDLYLGLGERRVVWSYSDHGVTLMDDAIAWIADGRQSQVSFRDIVEV